MAKNINHYQIGICLAFCVAVIDILFSLVFGRHEVSIGFYYFLFFLLIGLLFQSKIARYLLAAFYSALAVSFMWGLYDLGRVPTFFSHGRPVFSIWLASLLMPLSLATAYILLFSKPFLLEFSQRREMQPRYIKTLKKVVLFGCVATVVIITAIDVYFWGTHLP